MTAFRLADIAKMMDHSMLQPNLTDTELEAGCRLAVEYDVASVCIKPYAVPLAARLLKGTAVAVGTVIGFPHGSHATAAKVFEAEQSMRAGAAELDMVVNIGKVLGADWKFITEEIRRLVEAAHRGKSIVKVIFENCYLADTHKERLCQICADVGADFVKTSTGYGTSGATDDDLRLMRRCSPAHVKVKAAGGIRDFDRVLAVRELGVSRIGASATKAILDACKARLRGDDTPVVSPPQDSGGY